MINKTLYITDTETNGFFSEKKHAQLTEVACIKITPDGSVSYFESLIKPYQFIQPNASKVSGITRWDMLKNGNELQWVVSNLSFFIEIDKPHLIVGHNVVDFDLKFLNRDLKIVNTRISPENCWDTYKVMIRDVAGGNHLPIGALSVCDMKPLKKVGMHYDLKSAAMYYNTGVFPTHRAMSDCIATYHVLKQQFKLNNISHAINNNHELPKN